jgi:hypothetical protein
MPGSGTAYCEGDCSAQPDWHVSWVELQAEMHAPLADALRLDAGLLLGLGRATAGAGTTQVVRQLAACALQLIMQLVTVELWARRIRS